MKNDDTQTFGIEISDGVLLKMKETTQTLQDKLNKSEIFGVYDSDLKRDFEKRYEIRLVIEQHNIVLLCSATKGGKKFNNCLYVFRIIEDKYSNSVKNMSRAIKLDCKFFIINSANKNNIEDWNILCNFLKDDFEQYEKAKAKYEESKEQNDRESKSIVSTIVNKTQVLNMQATLNMIGYALRNAKSKIFISVPWIKISAFEVYEYDIKKALERGVDVYIKCGIQKRKETDIVIDQYSQSIINKLLEFENFRFYSECDDHSKIFIWDEECEWAMVGSFNYLSFNPIRTQSKRQETTILTNEEKVITKCKDNILLFFKDFREIYNY